MSRSSDFSYEMSGELPLDDALSPFAEEVRFAVSGPPPAPSLALAEVLASGFSGPISPTDKGDLLVTAASNVHGPAPQVAGLPNWKEEKIDMPVSGIVAGLLAKFSGVGTAAKAALAGVTAVTTMGLAGGAAGILPGPAQNLVAAAVNTATPFSFPDAGGVTGAVEHVVPALPVTIPALPTAVTTPPVSVAVKAGSSSASASTGAKAAPAVAPTIPNVTVPALPGVTIPPAVNNLVKGLPACVTNLVPTGGGTPDPAKLASQIPACITQVLGTAGLPPEVAKCVSSILGTIGGANGMSPTSVPSLSSLGVSSCVPMDVSKCVGNMIGLLGTIPGMTGGSIPGVGSIPGIGSLPNLSSIPGLSSVAGCVPMNVSACITSITNAVAAGTTPKLDLSACMPTGLPTTSIPGIGSVPGIGSIPGLSSLPGLGGALPFFGK